MKYDKDTMNSLQEAYASVNEEKYYKGDDRNPNTGFPKGIRSEKNKKVKQKRAKRPNYEGSTAGSDLKDIPEEQDLTGMTLKQKKQLERQEQLQKASKKAPTYKNKIVPMKTRTEEAIKISRKEYTSEEKTVKHKMTKDEFNRIPKDFRGGTKEKPRATVGITDEMGNTIPVSREVEIIKKKVVPEGVDKKKEMEDKMKEVEDMRSLPTRMNLIKTKLRAMGLNMSHQLKGKELSEVIDYTLVERTRYQKEMGIGKGGTKKPNFPKVPDPALDAAKKTIRAKYGKNAIMSGGSRQQKKVRGGPTGGGGKYLKMHQDKEQLRKDAEQRGFSNIQNYVNTMAIYGGKKNYDQGRGSGS